MFTISLIHIWTKETKAVEVDAITERSVSFRMGMSGAYDLDLRTNVITSRSPTVRRRHGALTTWLAADIAGVRWLVKQHLAMKTTRHGEALQTEEAMTRHARTMPGGK